MTVWKDSQRNWKNKLNRIYVIWETYKPLTLYIIYSKATTLHVYRLYTDAQYSRALSYAAVWRRCYITATASKASIDMSMIKLIFRDVCAKASPFYIIYIKLFVPLDVICLATIYKVQKERGRVAGMVVVEELWRIDAASRVFIYIYIKIRTKMKNLPVGERNHEIVRYSTLSLNACASLFFLLWIILGLFGWVSMKMKCVVHN